VIYFKELMMLQ